jgi:hypothetical protein
MSAHHEDGLVELLDVDTEGSIAFAVVEGLSGQTLRDRLRGGSAVGPDLALGLLEQLAALLDQATAQQTERAAISPRNLVVDDDRLTLVDLGLARLLDPQTRQLLFDADYEAVARIPDARLADLHGIGLLARELLTRAPASLHALLDRHLADPARPVYRSAQGLVTALHDAIDGADPNEPWPVVSRAPASNPPVGSAPHSNPPVSPSPYSNPPVSPAPQSNPPVLPAPYSNPLIVNPPIVAAPHSNPPVGAGAPSASGRVAPAPVPVPPSGQPGGGPGGQQDLPARIAAAAALVTRGEWDQAGRAYAEITRQAGARGNRQLATYAGCAMAAGAVAEAFAALAGGRLDLASQRIAAALGAPSSDRTLASKVAEAADSVTTIIARVRELTERLRAGSNLRGLRIHTQAIDTALDRPLVPRSFHDALDPIMVACDGALASGSLTPELARLGEHLPADTQNAWREVVRLLLQALGGSVGTSSAAAPTAASAASAASATTAQLPPGLVPAPSPVTARLAPPVPAGAVPGRRALPKVAVIAGIVAALAVVAVGALFLLSPSALRPGGPPAQVAGAPADQNAATPLALGGAPGTSGMGAVPGQGGPASAAPAAPVAVAAPPPGAASAARPGGLVAPQLTAAELAENRADDVLAQATGLIEAAPPDDDSAVTLLGELGQQLAPESPRRIDVNNLTGRALLDDAQRRTGVAFTRMHENQGADSKRLLGEARERIEQAAVLKPTDAATQERLAGVRDQLDLTGWWVDFDVAYQARSFDAQIDALKKIIARNPDYKTAEGSAREKLYAAYISKAEAARRAGQDDVAKQALADAAQVDPSNKLTEQLQAAWYPPPTPTPAPPTPVPTPVVVPQPPAQRPQVAAPKPAVVQQPVVQEQPAAPEPVEVQAPAAPPQPVAPIVVPPVVQPKPVPPTPVPAPPTPVPVPPTPVPVPPTPVPQPKPQPQEEQPHQPMIDVTLGGPNVGAGNDSNQQSNGGGSQGHGNEGGRGGN